MINAIIFLVSIFRSIYSDRFLGFGSVPLGLSLEETQEWIETHITANSLCGIGEFTPGSEQQIMELDTVF